MNYNYKDEIIRMIEGIDREDYLIRIYSFVKVKYDHESGQKGAGDEKLK